MKRQSVQFEQTNVHNFIKTVTTLLHSTNSYTYKFRAPSAHKTFALGFHLQYYCNLNNIAFVVDLNCNN